MQLQGLFWEVPVNTSGTGPLADKWSNPRFARIPVIGRELAPFAPLVNTGQDIPEIESEPDTVHWQCPNTEQGGLYTLRSISYI
jgi:hypothetical protein